MSGTSLCDDLKEGLVLNSTALFYTSEREIFIELPYEGLRIKLKSSSVAAKFLMNMEGKGKEIVCAKNHEALIKKMVLMRLLVPERFSKILTKGTTSEARSYERITVIPLESLSATPTIIGSSVDFAQVGRKSSFSGPQEIRRYISSPIQDIGNVTWLPIDNIDSYGKRVAYCIFLCCIQNALPIIIGGDHSISKFCFEELIRFYGGGVGVIHLDAHNDFGDSLETGKVDHLLHSNVLSHIANTDCEFIAQIGLRPEQIVARGNLFETPIYQLTDQEADKPTKFIDNLLQAHPNVPVYLTIDLDCLDPNIAPEVTTPLSGGINEKQLLLIVEEVLLRFNVIGIDLVEVSSANNQHNNAATIAARIIGVVNEKYTKNNQ